MKAVTQQAARKLTARREIPGSARKPAAAHASSTARSPFVAAQGQQMRRMFGSTMQRASKLENQPVKRSQGGIGLGSGLMLPSDGAVAQRQIDVVDPVVVKNRNIASAWMGGGDYAVTPAVINGKHIPPSSNRNGLIRPPQFDFIEDAGAQPQNRYQFRLTVPTQTVSYRLELPTDGPSWALPTLSRVEIVDAFLNESGITTPRRSEADEKKAAGFTIHSDGELAAQIRAHEEHHVREQRQAVDEILSPWDRHLEQSKPDADQLTNRGPLELLLEWDGPKETAQQIADQLVERMKELGEAYHKAEEGKPPVVAHWRVDSQSEPWQYEVWLRLAKV